jgi:serine/threonine-protein kinase ATR
VIPSPSTIEAFWPESQQLVALPHELQKTVSSQISAIYIAFNLLLALMKGACQQQRDCIRATTFEHHLPFVLDNCLVLWQHFQRWTISSDKRSFHDETISSYIQVLEAIAVPTKESDLQLSGSAKAARILVCGLSSLMEQSSLSVFNQIQLASLLIRMRTTLNNNSSSRHMPGRRCVNSLSILADELEASIANICHDAERFSILTKDLQVSFVLTLNVVHQS